MTPTVLALLALGLIATIVAWRVAARRRLDTALTAGAGRRGTEANARCRAGGDGAEMAVLLPAALAAGGSRADDGPVGGDGHGHGGGGGWGGGGASGDVGAGDGGGGGGGDG
jgi:hypothetical protein